MTRRTLSRRSADSADDTPRTRREGSTTSATRTTTVVRSRGGWDSYDKAKEEADSNSRFPERFKPDEDPRLIKFLDPAPFTAFAQHWHAKRSYPCPAPEEECPICDLTGDRPQKQFGFNVLDLEDPDDPQVKVWWVGVRVAGQIKKFAEEKKTAPVDRSDLYWEVSRSGTGSETTYSLLPIKARDLEEDWEMEPVSAPDMEVFVSKKYDEDVLWFPKYERLLKVARSMQDAEGDDD